VRKENAMDKRGGGAGRMQLAAVVLGVLGGLLGLPYVVLSGLLFGGLRDTLGLAFCLLGFLGAALALGRPRLGSLLLLVAGLGYAFAVSWYMLLAAPLLLLAAVLALLASLPAAQGVTR